LTESGLLVEPVARRAASVTIQVRQSVLGISRNCHYYGLSTVHLPQCMAGKLHFLQHAGARVHYHHVSFVLSNQSIIIVIILSESQASEQCLESGTKASLHQQEAELV